MKKISLPAVAAFAFMLASVYPLEVDRGEISVDTTRVEFINYTGAHDEINTIEEIQAIGSMLGLEIRPLPADELARVGNERYRVIHAVDPSETNGFDADILILGETAAVDHIDNLRRIISFYLSSAYGYPARDANTLAVFITVYNAIHRGDIAFFEGRYKDIVTNELSAASAGLAFSYTDWPGKTQIVIPLSDPMFSGTLSTVETSLLVEDDVIASIRADESSPQEIRRDMADLMEREGDEAEVRAEQARAEAAQARTEAARLEREAAETQREADAARREAEEAAAEAEAADRGARRAAQETAATAEERQREADSLREQQQAAEQRAAEAETRAEREQELADRRQEQAADARRQIASDTQSEIDSAAARREAAIAEASPAAALRITGQQDLLSEILLVNTGSGSVLRTSALNSIRNRTLLDTGEAYMAVAGQGAAVRLVLIDRLTLEVIRESEQAIASESVLAASGNDYYAVISRNGSFYIGRFDRNLNLQATSAIQVQPFTAIAVSEGRIIVQDTESNMRILRATDLIDLNR